MLSPVHVLDSLRAKPERASVLIQELDMAITQFHATIPYKVSSQVDQQTKQRTFYAHFTDDVPLDIATVIGNILHDLQSSLDHLAHHLVCVGTGSQGPFPYVYFPIFKSAQAYQTGKSDKIRGMRPEAIKAIDSLEPYFGGSGRVLWDLHKMNNIDKHRLLIPVLGILTAHTMPTSRREHYEKILRERFPAGMVFPLMNAENGPVFLKDEGPMFAWPSADLPDEMQFRIQIAFGEPDVVKGKAVVPTLENMVRIVLEIIEDFEAKGLL